jgi:hypothetical protein
MGLNWNGIKSRALLFSKARGDACNADSQAKPFWIGLFEIFGIAHKRVAAFELSVQKRGGVQGFVSLFWPGFAGTPHSDKHRNAIEQAAKGVRDARALFVDASVVGVYEPLTMPPALFKAHQKIDAAVDAGCLPSGGKKSYACGGERVGFLVEVCERITSLLPVAVTKKTREAKAIGNKKYDESDPPRKVGASERVTSLQRLPALVVTTGMFVHVQTVVGRGCVMSLTQ